MTSTSLYIPEPIINKILSYRGLHPIASCYLKHQIIKEFCEITQLDIRFFKNYLSLYDFLQIFHDKSNIVTENKWKIVRYNIFELFQFWNKSYKIDADFYLDNFIFPYLGDNEEFYFDIEGEYNKEGEEYRKQILQRWISIYTKTY